MSDLLDNLKILVAEDHFSARQHLITALHTRRQPQVDTAIDGKVAIEMIEQAYAQGMPYHIVFLDWTMPEVDGLEVLKYFREKPDYARTAFVMVTATSVEAKVREAIKSGATAYMIKPLSQAMIVKRFDEILGWVRHKNEAAFC